MAKETYPRPYQNITLEEESVWHNGQTEGDAMPVPESGCFVLAKALTDECENQGEILVKVLDYDDREGTLIVSILGCSDDYLQWYVEASEDDGGIPEGQKFHVCRCDAMKCKATPIRRRDEYFHVDSFKVVSQTKAKEILKLWGVVATDALVSPPLRPVEIPVRGKKNRAAGGGSAGGADSKRKKVTRKAVLKASEEEADEEERYTAAEWEAWEKAQKAGPPVEDSSGGSLPGTPENVLDKELGSLMDELGRNETGSAVDDQLEALKKKLSGQAKASPKPDKKATSEILAERAKQDAEKIQAAKRERESKDSEESALVKFLRKLSRDKNYDTLVSDEDEFEGGDDASASPLKSKRALLRRVAVRRPGLLLIRGLNMMRESLQPLTGDSEEDSLTPVCLRYYMSVYLPNHRHLGEAQLRELRTLSEAIDGLLLGKNVKVLDLLMQRLKAAMMAFAEGSWQSARWLELLAPDLKSAPVSIDEEELVRKVQAGEMTMMELVRKLKAGGSSEKQG
jgi:hypothetical protein